MYVCTFLGMFEVVLPYHGDYHGEAESLQVPDLDGCELLVLGVGV